MFELEVIVIQRIQAIAAAFNCASVVQEVSIVVQEHTVFDDGELASAF